jgi:S1-C subfamily serine protease
MLPACLLRRFHEDVKQSPYEGFASAGFLWKDLVDPAKRAWLGVTDPGRGVQVLACVPGSGAADALRPGDVVLRWDSFDVDNLGFYEDPDFGRLALSYLVLGRRRPGDAVPCVIVRDKRRIETQVKLGRWSDGDALIPENVEGARAAYLVEGGLILQELSGKYLKAYGGRWEQRVDPRLSHAYTTSRLAPEKPGDRIVVLSGVLPDTANIGYEGFRDAVVTAVNGQPVRNLADVFRAVDRDGCVYRVSLQSVGTDLVLDRASLEEANARLARQYRITQRSWRGGPDK